MTLDADQQAQKDASVLNGKKSFVNECRDLSGQLRSVFANATGLQKAYFDKGYNVGGTAPIADVDLVDYKFDEASLAAFINMLGEIRKLATSDPENNIAPGDFVAVNNQIS